MNAKDQRLEIRIPQNQLDEIDNIRSSVDSPYTLSRSDVARTFISQGIDRYKNGGEESPAELSLGQRLSIFFQLEQPESLSTSQHQTTKISAFTLVKNIYLERFFWFFELDDESLEKLGRYISGKSILSVMNKETNKETKRNLEYVCELVRMFKDIDDCIKSNRDRHDALNLIEKHAHRYGIPLKFLGFHKESRQLNEMAALVSWLDQQGRATYIHVKSSEIDNSSIYRSMLNVYTDIKKNDPHLTLDNLEEIITYSK